MLAFKRLSKRIIICVINSKCQCISVELKIMTHRVGHSPKILIQKEFKTGSLQFSRQGNRFLKDFMHCYQRFNKSYKLKAIRTFWGPDDTKAVMKTRVLFFQKFCELLGQNVDYCRVVTQDMKSKVNMKLSDLPD